MLPGWLNVDFLQSFQLSIMQSMVKPERTRRVRYGAAVLFVLLALLAMLLLNPWIPMQQSPFLVFFAAVMASAWYGGMGAGLLATALTALAADYFFMPPAYSLFLKGSSDTARLGLFILVSLMIISLSSARRQLVKALRQERDLITAIVGTAGSLIVVLDRRGRIIQFNRACERLTGYTFAEVSGKHIWDLFLLAAEVEPVKRVFQTLCIDAAPNEYENYWVAKDGTRHLIAWSNSALLDDRGTVRYVIGTGLDITERKRAEQTLQATNQELQALIQASPVAISVLDQQGVVKRWNPAAERIFGWPAADVINRVMPTVPDDKRAEFWANIEATLRGNLINGLETSRQRRDGSLIHVGVWTAVLRGPTAEDDRIISIVADLSDRKQAERALKLSQERLTSFVEANVIGILFGDTTGGIIEANDEFLRIVGYTRDDLHAGRLRWTSITPAQYLPLDDERIREAKTKGGCTPYEKEYFRKDGSRVSVLVGFSLLGEEQEQTVAFILDLTERKRLEHTLRRQTDELARANRLKDEFLAVLSHELRTPLNSIVGWAQLLRTREFDAATKARALETIERNARLQNQLVDDILDVSQIIRGKLRLQPRPVELVGVITAAIDAMRPAAAAKSILIRTELDSALDTSDVAASKVLGDPDRLQQVVWNLLSNAIKFTPVGGWVEVRLTTDHNPAANTVHTPYAQITVTDSGNGISADFLPFVFDRFRQADSSATRAEGGLGLGLAIVRHLVELHGGTVRADSPGIGQGATFTITLPLINRP